MPVSELLLRFVLNLSEQEALAMAKRATDMITTEKERRDEKEWRLQFSFEEFSDADTDFVVKVAKEVIKAWKPIGPKDKVIFNLPSTVERVTPNVYADQVELFRLQLEGFSSHFLVSTHTHNDQGCAVAAPELGLLAGALRVEGTLLGYGERSGNMCLINLALNFEARNVRSGLNFRNFKEVIKEIRDICGIEISMRHPYCGQDVFTSFSGLHQAAIAIVLKREEEVNNYFDCQFKLPYNNIDPSEIGMNVSILISSQSGRNGLMHIMNSFGFNLGNKLALDFQKRVQEETEAMGKSLEPGEIKELFFEAF